MLETFAVVGEPDTVVTTIRQRFGGVIDSVVLDPTTMKTTFVGGHKTLPIHYTLT